MTGEKPKLTEFEKELIRRGREEFEKDKQRPEAPQTLKDKIQSEVDVQVSPKRDQGKPK